MIKHDVMIYTRTKRHEEGDDHMTAIMEAVRELPALSYEDHCWLYAHTFGDRLVIRHSDHLKDFGLYPMVQQYLNQNDLELVGTTVDEDDEYMTGFSVILEYRAVA